MTTCLRKSGRADVRLRKEKGEKKNLQRMRDFEMVGEPFFYYICLSVCGAGGVSGDWSGRSRRG